jgi:hypothetical protein
MEDLTADTLRSYFSYDPRTGLLSWKIKRKGIIPGPISTLDHSGYVVVTVDRKRRYVHRIIYKMFYDLPDNMFIDHINGNKSDNRLDNLRLTDRSGNELNKPLTSRNTTGYKNISYYSADKSYVAELLVKGKRIKKYIKSEIGDQEVLKDLNTWVSTMRERLCNGFHNHGEHNSI